MPKRILKNRVKVRKMQEIWFKSTFSKKDAKKFASKAYSVTKDAKHNSTSSPYALTLSHS